MDTQINLLQQQKSIQKKKSAFFKACLTLLILSILITVGEIAYTYYLRTRIFNLGEAQSATLSQIAKLDSKRVKFQTLKERLVSIGKILPESTRFNNRVDAIYKNIPSGLTIADMDASISVITIKVTSSNLALINSFLDEGVKNIVAEKNIGVQKSEISSVGRGNTQSIYAATIKFTFTN